MADIYVLTNANSTTLYDCLDSLYKFNYETTIIHGYTLFDNYKKNEIVFNSFRDKILPLAIENNRDIFFIEDDTIINEALPLPDTLADVSFIGYHGIRKDHIIGANIVYFNYNVLKYLKCDMDKSRSQHFDMYISKFVRRQAIEYKIVECYDWSEKKHDSLNVNGIRYHKRVI
tara:strand:+ start:621 stop:1139 length:519 start_codon:yes stop_codon:yes gene_type:complete